MRNFGEYLGIWAILWALLEEDLGTTWVKLWDYLGNTLAIPLHFWHYKDTTWALFWNNLGISWAIFDTFGHIVTTSWLLAERGPGQHIAIFAINIMIFRYMPLKLKVSFIPYFNILYFYLTNISLVSRPSNQPSSLVMLSGKLLMLSSKPWKSQILISWILNIAQIWILFSLNILGLQLYFGRQVWSNWI